MVVDDVHEKNALVIKAQHRSAYREDEPWRVIVIVTTVLPGLEQSYLHKLTDSHESYMMSLMFTAGPRGLITAVCR